MLGLAGEWEGGWVGWLGRAEGSGRDGAVLRGRIVTADVVVPPPTTLISERRRRRRRRRSTARVTFIDYEIYLRRRRRRVALSSSGDPSDPIACDSSGVSWAVD